MHTPSCEQLKRENRYLQDEIADARERQERQQEEAHREREQRRQAQREQWQAEQCEADDWDEAFAKGLPRIHSEAEDEKRYNEQYASEPDYQPQTWFQDWEKEVRRAKEIYSEVMRETEEKIKQIRVASLQYAADRLEAELGETGMVQALRDDDYEVLVNW